MKLLLVEDSERLRLTVQRGLIAAGFTVDVAADGAVANGFLHAYSYDLVVLDLTLPLVDGLTVLRGMSTIGGLHGIHFIEKGHTEGGDRLRSNPSSETPSGAELKKIIAALYAALDLPYVA